MEHERIAAVLREQTGTYRWEDAENYLQFPSYPNALDDLDPLD
jgi:hypothetical protein